MNERRQYARHVFRETDRPQVEVQAGSLGLFSGEVHNLSLGGLGTKLDITLFPLKAGKSSSIIPLVLETTVQVRLYLPQNNQHLTMDCQVVHGQDNNGLWGLQILPLMDRPSEETRQKKLWRFLLEDQQRQIRLRRQPKS